MECPASSCVYFSQQPHRVNTISIPISEMENQACEGRNNHPPKIIQLGVSALGSNSGRTDSRSHVWFPPKIRLLLRKKTACGFPRRKCHDDTSESCSLRMHHDGDMWLQGSLAESPGQHLHEPVSMSPGFPSQNCTPASISEGKTSTLSCKKGSGCRIRILSCPRRSGRGGLAGYTGQPSNGYSLHPHG